MRMLSRIGYALSLATLLGLPQQAAAQDYQGAHLRDVQVGVLMQPAEDATAQEAVVNAPFLAGDRIWTDATGRAEIQLSTGSLVRLDTHSKLDLSGVDAQGATLNLWSGSTLVAHPGGTQVEVLVPGGRVWFDEPGRYRVDVYRGDVRVCVYEGRAHFEAAGTQVQLASLEHSVAGAGLPPEAPVTFDPWRERDDFVAYSEERDATLVAASRSREYLPEPVQSYGTDFDDNGTWYFEADLGYVWQPRVAATWRPYVNGRWVWTWYGWTWVSYEPWGWATSHYGRWGFSAGLGWYWSPGSVWSGGWVSWAVGPSYVAWCPLDYYDRPVAVPYHHGRGSRHAVPRSGFHGRGSPSGGGWTYVDRGDMGRHAQPRVADAGQLRGGFAQASPNHLGRDLTIAQAPVGAATLAASAAQPRGAAQVRSSLSTAAERRLPIARPTFSSQRSGRVGTGAPPVAAAGRATSRTGTIAPRATTTARPAQAAAPRSTEALREMLERRSSPAERPAQVVRPPAETRSPRPSGAREVAPNATQQRDAPRGDGAGSVRNSIERSRTSSGSSASRTPRPTSVARPSSAPSEVQSRDTGSRSAKPARVSPRVESRPAPARTRSASPPSVSSRPASRPSGGSVRSAPSPSSSSSSSSGSSREGGGARAERRRPPNR